MVSFQVFEDCEALSRAAARYIYEQAEQAVTERGRFTIALSGGSTPTRLFSILSKPPYRHDFPWQKTVVFWGDDRVVPPDHEWSNYRLARLLLDRVAVPKEQIHRVKGELDASRAVETMLRDLEQVFGKEGMPCFDVVLQGLGEDGHTASLFPGTEALDAVDWVVPVVQPPAEPAVDRITLTIPVLNAARTAVFLVAGAGKRDKLATILNDPTAGERYPAACIEAGETVWFVDEAAFGAGSLPS